MLSNVGNDDSVANQDYELQAPCDDTPLPASPAHKIPEQMYSTPLPVSPAHEIPEQTYGTPLPAPPAHEIPEPQTYGTPLPASPAHEIPEQMYGTPLPTSPAHEIPEQMYGTPLPTSPAHEIPKPQTYGTPLPASPVHSDYETYTQTLIDLNLDELVQLSVDFPKHARSMALIHSIQNASLNDGIGLTGAALEHLHNPPNKVLDLNDPYAKLAIEIFMALEHSSEATYDKICSSIHVHIPGSQLPLFYQVKQLLTDVTGVMSIVNHMCINSCTAFVGPYADLDACPECAEARFDVHARGHTRPHAVFHTIPIGPQLQALWRHPETAGKMHYRQYRTEQILEDLRINDGLINAYDDIFCGSAYVHAFCDGVIEPDDTLLMISIDGAQLFESKESDCWIYIWIILELSLDH